MQIDSLAEMIMFADDTSILVSNTNYDDFMTVFNLVLLHISKWFQANQWTLNTEKTNNKRFTPTNFSHYPLNLVYADQALTELDTINFSGLHLITTLRGSHT